MPGDGGSGFGDEGSERRDIGPAQALVYTLELVSIEGATTAAAAFPTAGAAFPTADPDPDVRRGDEPDVVRAVADRQRYWFGFNMRLD